MRIKVTHTVGDLADDLAGIPKKAAVGGANAVRKNATEGNRIAKRFAKESSGSHGVHYPNAFTVEMLGPFSAEYGPDAAKKQGGMATGFEWAVGRQTTPHMNLWRSADIIGPKFGDAIADVADGLFW